MKKIVYCQPLKQDSAVRSKFLDIKNETLKAIDDTLIYWRDLNNEGVLSFHRLDIEESSILQPNPILTIEKTHTKKSIIVALFHEKNIHKFTSSKWSLNTGSRYIIEIIVDDTITICANNINHFSTSIHTGIGEIRAILGDIFMDLLIEHALDSSKSYERIMRSINPHGFLENKQNYIKKHHNCTNKTIGKLPKGYPFISSLHRKSDNSYSYIDVIDEWLNFMSIISLKNSVVVKPKQSEILQFKVDVPVFKDFQSVLDQLPKKVHGQLGKIQIKSNNLNDPNILICLKKSLIGSTNIVQKRINSLYRGNPKINMVRVLPYEKFRMLKDIEHFLYVIPFKLNKD